VLQVFIRDKELAWLPARLLDMQGGKATVSVPSYPGEFGEFDIDMGGRGASSWADRTINMKDYAEFGGQLPLQNNKVLDDMVDLPYLHEVSSQASNQRVAIKESSKTKRSYFSYTSIF
jgi:hypothetical protein